MESQAAEDTKTEINDSPKTPVGIAVDYTKIQINESNQVPKNGPFRRPLKIGAKIVAEFIGTMIFIFLALATAQGALTSGSEGSIVLTIATGFGLSMVVTTLMVREISGAHLNPAVTMALTLLGKCNPALAIAYVIMQLAGAVTGAALAKFIHHSSKMDEFLPFNTVNTALELSNALGAEIILTMIFVFICLNSGGLGTTQAAFSIGAGLWMVHLVGIPIDGTSVNPARSFGAAVIANKWNSHWVFWAGPMVGSISAAVLFYGIQKVQKQTTLNQKMQ